MPGRYGVLALPTVILFAGGEPVPPCAAPNRAGATRRRSTRGYDRASSERMLPGEELLAGIAGRDYARIAACFAESARFDVLTRAAARAQGASGLRPPLLARAAGAVRAPRGRRDRDLRPHPRALPVPGQGSEKGWQLNEHTAYAAVEDGRIRAMTLTCAGFRPTSAP